jgi:hypothetical protein
MRKFTVWIATSVGKPQAKFVTVNATSLEAAMVIAENTHKGWWAVEAFYPSNY